MMNAERDLTTRLFLMFQSRMAKMLSVMPPSRSNEILWEDWFAYVDSLAPEVETIRLSKDRLMQGEDDGGLSMAIRRLPVLNSLVERLNRGPFDKIVINDPLGPSLILVSRDFALKALSLGELP